MLGHINNIWRKELLDGTRDRRSLAQSLLLPLILGIMAAVLSPVMTAVITSRQQSSVTIPAQGIEYLGRELIDTFRLLDITLEPHAGDLEATIRSGDEAAGLIVPEGFSDRIDNEEPAGLILLTNRTSGGIFGGSFSVQRLVLAINSYNQLVSIERVELRGVDPALLVPVELESRDLATPEQLGGFFAAFMLPILIGMVAVLGGLFIAIDVTAGEKERGTLEALLVTPASDAAIFFGKLAAVFTMTAVPIVLAFMGFWAASNLLPESVTKGAVLPIGVIFGAILIGLPLALFIGVVLMTISIRTKSFKAAQSSVGAMQLFVLIPIFAAAFVLPTESTAFLIPIYGPAAVVAKLAVGATLPDNAILFGIISSLLAASVAMVIALRLFNRERLLYSV